MVLNDLTLLAHRWRGLPFGDRDLGCGCQNRMLDRRDSVDGTYAGDV